MKLPNDDELTPEAHEAIIACLRIAAKRGRQLRLERERGSQMLQDSISQSDAVSNQDQSPNNPSIDKDESKSIQT